jgi:hypothetical protein
LTGATFLAAALDSRGTLGDAADRACVFCGSAEGLRRISAAGCYYCRQEDCRGQALAVMWPEEPVGAPEMAEGCDLLFVSSVNLSLPVDVF